MNYATVKDVFGTVEFIRFGYNNEIFMPSTLKIA